MKKLLLLLPILLTACAMGQKIDPQYSPPGTISVNTENVVRIDVEDKRAFVVNMDKKPYYIGHFRSGFGIPHDVDTVGNVALAELIQTDLMQDLRDMGFTVDKDGFTRKLVVIIEDFNFNTYVNARVWYSLLVQVTEANGQQIMATKVTKDQKLDVGAFQSPVLFMKDTFPVIYEEMIHAIVRENPEVIAALVE